MFASGFVARPLGGLAFGYLADRYGRRSSLMLSVLLMCFGSLTIALTPTVQTIGVAAPVILTLARILQGASQGGEYGVSATYLAEISASERRGFYSGVWYTTLKETKEPFVAFLIIALAWAIATGYTSVAAIVKAELFPTAVRAMGVGLPYALTVAVFGGATDSVGLYFKDIGHEEWFYFYATALTFVSLMFYIALPDTRRTSRMEQHS